MMNLSTLDSGLSFPMGKGKSSRVVSPEVGAHEITLNLSVFEDGDEFPQHVHDISEDCFIVLDGSVSLRQGDAYTPLLAGQAVWVPVGEVHGTYNHSGQRAELISFQSPPDLALYRGDRDGGHGELPTPEGENRSRVVTLAGEDVGPIPGVGAVDGEVRSAVDPRRGAEHLAVERIVLDPGGRLDLVPDGREHVLVVLDGTIVAPSGEPVSARGIVFGLLDEQFTATAGDDGCVLLHSHSQRP
jgi:quercetin dioxygenase-like cupin family protein